MPAEQPSTTSPPPAPPEPVARAWFSRAAVHDFIFSEAVQRVVIGVILVNAVTLGLQTVRGLDDGVVALLGTLDLICLTVYVVELTLKLYADRLAFFRRGWNIFDLAVVAISLVPGSGEYAVLRALRVLRILRLISVVPALRRVVTALGRAIPGIAAVGALMVIIFYVGAVMATTMFGEQFPDLFGHLGTSLFSLFQLTTFDSWTLMVRTVAEENAAAWPFFIIFVVVSGLTVLNLVIAVIVDAMQQFGPTPSTTTPSDEEAESAPVNESEIAAELAALRREVSRLTEAVGRNARSTHDPAESD